MIGVTGTQGKTTTTRLLESGLERRRRAGRRDRHRRHPGRRARTSTTALTTPEAPDLHALSRRCASAGCEACAMEVSSHALVMGRVDGVVFDVAVFLNLGRDHLDFHRDVDDYFDAKASLFTPSAPGSAWSTSTTSRGRRLLERAGVPVRDLLDRRAPTPTGGSPTSSCAPTGAAFRITRPRRSDVAAGCPLPGDFNVSNTLAAVAAAGEAGLRRRRRSPPASPRAAACPGRLERVDAGQDFVVVVDYAHKPDAVAAALAHAAPAHRRAG